MMSTGPDAPERPSATTPPRVLQFDRTRLSAEQRARLPYDAHIEVDADQSAYLCVEGRRLFFAGTLPRLLETLERLYLGPIELTE